MRAPFHLLSPHFCYSEACVRRLYASSSRSVSCDFVDLLFSDIDDSDLLTTKKSAPAAAAAGAASMPTAAANQPAPAPAAAPAKPKKSSLFADDEDDGGLFGAGSKAKSGGDDDLLFAAKPAAAAAPAPAPAAAPAAEPTKRKSALFADDEDTGLFGAKPAAATAPAAVAASSSAPTTSAAAPAASGKKGLFFDPTKLLPGAKPVLPRHQAQAQAQPAESGLFGDESQPAPAQPAQAQPAPAAAAPVAETHAQPGSAEPAQPAPAAAPAASAPHGGFMIDPTRLMPGARPVLPRHAAAAPQPAQPQPAGDGLFDQPAAAPVAVAEPATAPAAQPAAPVKKRSSLFDDGGEFVWQNRRLFSVGREELGGRQCGFVHTLNVFGGTEGVLYFNSACSCVCVSVCTPGRR